MIICSAQLELLGPYALHRRKFGLFTNYRNIFKCGSSLKKKKELGLLTGFRPAWPSASCGTELICIWCQILITVKRVCLDFNNY